MAFKGYDQLNDMQLDVLRELGNIGAGNAATSLSSMLNRPVSITVPTGILNIKVSPQNSVVLKI